MLARDDTARSASTMLREHQDPAVRLGDSVERYIDALRAHASSDQRPSWAERHRPVPVDLATEIRVWRAATRIDNTDRRPTGPAQLGKSARACQNQFDQALATSHAAMREGGQRSLSSHSPRLATATSLCLAAPGRGRPRADDSFPACLLVRDLPGIGLTRPHQDHVATPATSVPP
jgi:hypothetical protein